MSDRKSCRVAGRSDDSKQSRWNRRSRSGKYPKMSWPAGASHKTKMGFAGDGGGSSRAAFNCRSTKSPRSIIREQQIPVRAVVSGLIDPGFLAGPAAHQVCDPLVNAVDASKIECLRAGNSSRLPRCSTVDSAKPDAIGAAGPNHVRSNYADPTQRGLCSASLVHPRLAEQSGCGNKEHQRSFHRQ